MRGIRTKQELLHKYVKKKMTKQIQKEKFFFPQIVSDCNKKGFAGFHHIGFGAALFISQCNAYKKLNQTLQHIFGTATNKQKGLYKMNNKDNINTA